ncbi:response regulator transcription factor [Bacillus sp. FJAT-49736]|uniref:response regulator transcription factor n=1 Tax=Bacillus sp. FJAT-49736 TaxID=2833582 RepID=UPI001BC92E0E|nr:response regulator transcription factor [Bacillus sp. FJAT-49736]MBS4174957.1 response regulator transcription factor [Bacillus sp. FJAT-49736]
MIQIGIAEDQALVRESLAIIIDLEQDMKVIWKAATGAQALNMFSESPVDVVLMDLRMPDLDGVSATRKISALSKTAQTIVLTTFDHDEWILDALHAGAVSCFLKEVPPHLLINAIRLIYQCEFEPEKWSKEWRKYTPEIQFKAKRNLAINTSFMDLKPLTNREMDILKRMEAGQSNSEIAKALFLSEGTVKNYVSNLYSKIGVRTRGEAAKFARDRGITL